MRGRPPRFHIGEMRDRIAIQEATVAISAGGTPVRTWTDKYDDQPAKYWPVAGEETIRGRSVEAGIAVIFTMRKKTGITPLMQVVHSSGTYGIVHVKPVDGMPIFTELHCKQAVA